VSCFNPQIETLKVVLVQIVITEEIREDEEEEEEGHLG
jgi:hypothetical protein